MISLMNAICPPVQNLLDLFSGELAGVRFGDVDAQALLQATASVETAAAEVASLETTLAEARARLQEQQDALLQQAHRALAYARVYAEADAELSARLEAIALPRAPRRGRGDVSAPSSARAREPGELTERRPRGRPRKSALPENEPLLNGVAAAE